MKTIHLSNGGDAIVDDADFQTLNHWKWKRHKHGYACRTATGGRLVLMHRQIMEEPEGLEVDHRNRQKLDNRRGNLRVATHSDNGRNRPKQRNNTSGYKGVSWDRQRSKWRASIKVGRTRHTIGRFDTAEDAAAAYDAKVREVASEFGFTNEVCPHVAAAVALANLVECEVAA
jgi:hypothetical protein